MTSSPKNGVATAPKRKLTPKQQQIVDGFLDTVTGPFRRLQLSNALEKGSKVDFRVADEIAGEAMAAWAKAGRITRHGHVHWTRPLSERKLLSGRMVPEQSGIVNLPLSTRVPQKWVSIDLETGQVWVGTVNGWAAAKDHEVTEALESITSLQKPAPKRTGK